MLFRNLLLTKEPIASVETTEIKVETPVEPVEDKPKYHYKQQYTIQISLITLKVCDQVNKSIHLPILESY